MITAGPSEVRLPLRGQRSAQGASVKVAPIEHLRSHRPFYDVDMARNMPFDGVGFSAGAGCAEANGLMLELGCGNGRILLPGYFVRGIDAMGVDASPG